VTTPPEPTPQDRERLYVGSTRRMIEAMVGRVLAGDDPQQVANDYHWEWGHGPDLSPIAEAIARARHAGEVAERERCAQLAEAETTGFCTCERCVTLRHVAAAIRSLAPASEVKP